MESRVGQVPLRIVISGRALLIYLECLYELRVFEVLCLNVELCEEHQCLGDSLYLDFGTTKRLL